MKKRNKYIFLAGGLITAFVILLNGCESNGHYEIPQKKKLIEAVYASGVIQSRGEYVLVSQAEGVLVNQLVEIGQLVEEGQQLFLIQSSRQSANLANARKAYELASKNKGADSPMLQDALHTINQALLKYETDSVNFRRFENLRQQGATSDFNYDAAKTAFNLSKENLQKSRQALRLLKDKLSSEWVQADNQLKVALEEEENYVVRSSKSGTLYETFKETGEFVRRGEPIAILGSDSSYFAKLRIDERDILQIKNGQRVLIKIDAYPDRIFEAVLSNIYAKIDPRDQSLRADAMLIDPLPGNFTGMALEGNIIIREKTDAWVIPLNLLLPGDSLLIATANGKEKVKVEKGIVTLNEVEIVSGISASTKMIKP